MARVTVSDCLEKVDNRFELVLLASRRARQLMDGAEATVDLENDKSTVVALREIAEGNVTQEVLDELDNPPANDELIESVAAELAVEEE